MTLLPPIRTRGRRTVTFNPEEMLLLVAMVGHLDPELFPNAEARAVARKCRTVELGDTIEVQV